MKKLLLTLAFLCPTMAWAQPDYSEGLPFIAEDVDALVIVITDNSDHCRVVFVRGKTVLATRLVVDEMIWYTRDGKFYLLWEDYWTADRLVSTENVSIEHYDKDPTQVGQNSPWWCMFRNMRDLKQP